MLICAKIPTFSRDMTIPHLESARVLPVCDNDNTKEIMKISCCFFSVKSTRLAFKKLRTIAERIIVTREPFKCLNFAFAETSLFHFFRHFKL